MRGDDLGSREKIKTAKGLVWYPAETDVSIRPGWFYHETEDQKVRSAENLKEIYFHSVGRNGVLLLNIPPDKNGLLTAYDVKALQQWKQKRDAIFKVNFLQQAKPAKTIAVLTDNNDATAVSLAADTATIEFDLKKACRFNVLKLQENIRVGQRIEQFIFEYRENGEWKKAAAGTTVGYKRLLEFPAITASKVRLRILSSRLQPALAEMGLYFSDTDK